VCCRWLSELTFGNGDYWWGFACLSISVLLSSLNNGEAAVFQGLQRFKKLAWCTMLGSVGGLLVSIPMFYIWRINSIVPSILAYIVMTWIAMGLYRERVDRDNQSMSVAQTLALGKRFLSLGAFITVTSIVSNAINYIFLSYLNRCYSVEIAGYYNAGFTLVNRYAGLIFSAIAMEYFPRLASVARSNHRTSLFVTNQLQLTVAILLPVVTLFIAFSKVITHLLYIEEFTVIVPFVVWAMVGTLFRAISWSMSFVIVARSDGRVFLCTELLSCAFSIGINILAYNKFGFAGLGVAYILWYMFYTVVVATVYFRRYHLHLNVNCLRVSAYALLPAIAAAVTASLVNPLWALPIAIGSCVMSFYLVKRKLG
jgi:PST family polysaccharide transporter